MKKERMLSTTVTFPKPLLKKATARAKERHGKRGLSIYVRSVVTADLARK